MYARIVQVPLVAGASAAAADYFRSSVGPALKGQDGFLNSRFLVDDANSRCLMVTLWSTEAARTGAETNGFLKEVLQNMKPYFAGPPTISYYEVAVQIS